MGQPEGIHPQKIVVDTASTFGQSEGAMKNHQEAAMKPETRWQLAETGKAILGGLAVLLVMYLLSLSFGDCPRCD